MMMMMIHKRQQHWKMFIDICSLTIELVFLVFEDVKDDDTDDENEKTDKNLTLFYSLKIYSFKNWFNFKIIIHS